MTAKIECEIEWVKFRGIDGDGRAIFKSEQYRNFYGSTDHLFDDEATEEDVLKAISVKNLVFFGSRFGCEPMGTEVSNVKIRRTNLHVCIIPMDGYMQFQTSDGKRGSNPCLQRSTWAIVEELKEKFEEEGATTEVIADGELICKMATEHSKTIENKFGKAIAFSKGKDPQDKVNKFATDGYIIHAVIGNEAYGHRIIVGNTRVTIERELFRAREKVKELEEMLQN